MNNTTTNCCRNPDVAVFDYDDYDFITRTFTSKVNRVCLHCMTHWFGEPGAVKQFTRQEWDAWLLAEAQ